MPVRLGLSVHNATAIRMEHLTGYVGGVVRSQKYKTGGDFFQLAGRPSGVSEPNVATSLAGKVEGIKRFSLLVSASTVAICGRGRQPRKSRENPAKSCWRRSESD